MNKIRNHPILKALTIGVMALMLSIGFAPAASAEATFTVEWTKVGIYPRSEPSMASSKVGKALPDGTPIVVVCEAKGQSVTSAAGTSDIWEKLSDGTWLPNVYVMTGVDGWSPNIPRCSDVDDETVDQLARSLHMRLTAAQWAKENYSLPLLIGASECTIFVSQALWASGIPTTKDWSSATSDKSKQGGVRLLNRLTGGSAPTKTATAADEFKNYAVSSGLGTLTEISWADNTAGGAQLGDVIAYDWEGRPDGIIDHLAIVTGIDSNGFPSVTQRTSARLDRFWSWDPGANDWIQNSHRDPATGDEPRVYLIQINY